eukprot:364852-Chlamydomonas_euryale.AAC.1
MCCLICTSLQKLKEFFEEHTAERELLRHDNPLHRHQTAAHLKHVPAYLKDPSIIRESSNVGAGHAAMLARAAKRRKKAGVAQAADESNSADPLKAVTGFAKAPKSGKQLDEELTEMEKRAEVKGKKEAKAKAKAAGPAALPKANVRKNVRAFKRRR